MTFAGDFGPGAAMLPIVILSTPQGVLTYNPNGISVDLQKGNDASSFAVPQIDTLRIIAGNGQGAPLSVFVAAGDGSSGDRGTLTTAFPKPTEQGIPANFGPGAGNWTQADIERVRVLIIAQQTGSLVNASIGNVVTQSLGLAATPDLSIVFRNISLADNAGLTIDLEYRHSIIID